MTRLLTLTRCGPGPTEVTQRVGVVADAVIFPDGSAVLHWRTVPSGTEFYPTEKAMRLIRESSGRSYFTEVIAE